MKNFLNKICGLKSFEILKLKQDASLRKYWRILTNDKSYVLMDGDALVNKFMEFANISKLLNSVNVRAPKVLFEDMNNGFMLLEDLGDDTFTKLLAQGNAEAELYEKATELLTKVVKIEEKPTYISDLTDDKIINDICFFTDWYYPIATGKLFPDENRAEFIEIVKNLLPLNQKVPNSLLMWDYHVDNVMMVDNECAVLDFQDAMWGPVTYDIMSLLEDARREVSTKVYQAMKDKFFASLTNVKREDFEASFAIMAMFRHMRVLGRFTILMAKHEKDAYLRHVPHLWNMLNRALENPHLAKMKKWVKENFPTELRVPPKTRTIKKAMILAAGRGVRMGSMTENTPKPLVKVQGKTLIDYKLDLLQEAGFKDIVVNVCYLGEQIKEHLRDIDNFNFLISEEKEALETGGGIKKALPMLGNSPFLVLNCDTIWREENYRPIIWQMMDAWDYEKYDILLLLFPMSHTVDLHNKIGNYNILKDGSLERNIKKTDGFEYFFSGISIVNPKIFEGIKEEKFSMRDLYDQAQNKGRLGHIISNNKIFHVGSPEDWTEAEENF